MNSLAFMATAGILTLLLCLIFLALAIVYYVIRSLALYNMFKSLGYDKAWFAWLPICSQYALGDVATANCSYEDGFHLFGRIVVPDALCKWWILGVVIGSVVLGWLEPVCSLLIIVATVFFTAGILSELVAWIRNEDTTAEIGMSILASIIPIADIVYFKKITKDLMEN